MNAVCWFVSLVVELYETFRYRRAGRRCEHVMRQQPGGPTCVRCDRAWAWTYPLIDD